MNFVSASDSLYCMNWVDAIGKLNWTTYTNPIPLTDTNSSQVVWLNDLTSSWTANWLHTYIIQITATWTPDTFKWNIDWWAYTTWVSITWWIQALTWWFAIKFAATTGHTLNDTWTLTTWLAPAFWVWYDNSMFVSGFPTYPNRLYKSNENNPDSYSWTWSDIFDASYPVVWLAVWWQTLYIFTEETIDMINNNSIKQIGSDLVYTSIPLEATEWASNHNSIVSVGKDVMYLSKSNKIRRITPNWMLYYDVWELSHRANKGINKTMETLDPDQTKSFAYHLPDFQIVKWHLKTRGATYNDICITYNYEYDEFMVDTQKVFTGWCWYKSKAFTISQIEPKMYQDEYSTTDDDVLIQFEYRTKHIDLFTPTILKELWEIRSFFAINSSTELKQSIYADWSLIDTRTYTKADIPVIVDWIWTKEIWTYGIGEDSTPSDVLYNITAERPKGYLQKRCKYFEIRYTCASLWARVLLQNVIPKIETLSPLTTSNII